MPRSADEAITWGRQQVTNGSSHWFNICLIFVRSCFDVDALYPDAGTAWNLAKLKHRTSDPSQIPAGAPVFWETPGEFDHIALSTGGGRCLSNDIRSNGYISEVPIDEITRNWNSPLLGWTEDLNGVTVYSPEEPDVPFTDWPKKDRDALVNRTAAAVVEAILSAPVENRNPDGSTSTTTLGKMLTNLEVDGDKMKGWLKGLAAEE